MSNKHDEIYTSNAQYSKFRTHTPMTNTPMSQDVAAEDWFVDNVDKIYTNPNQKKTQARNASKSTKKKEEEKEKKKPGPPKVKLKKREVQPWFKEHANAALMSAFEEDDPTRWFEFKKAVELFAPEVWNHETAYGKKRAEKAVAQREYMNKIDPVKQKYIEHMGVLGYSEELYNLLPRKLHNQPTKQYLEYKVPFVTKSGKKSDLRTEMEKKRIKR